MRSHLRVLALAALLVPGLAMAAIANSKHDLSFGSTTPLKTTDNTAAGGQICIFCHTPHKANQQALIWNHAQSAATIGFTAANTTAGTPLPTTISAPGTKRCMDCHDATVSLGQVANIGGGVNGTFNMTNGITVMPTAYQVGPSLDNNHPVGIPYAGASYNGVTSGVSSSSIGVAGGFYNYTASSACLNGSGVCTTASNTIEIVRGSTSGYGMECVSCHEPHNRYAFSYLLRADPAGSAICLSCHNK